MTRESVDFTKTWTSGAANNKQKEESLRNAIQAHGNRAREAKVFVAIFLSLKTTLFLYELHNLKVIKCQSIYVFMYLRMDSQLIDICMVWRIWRCSDSSVCPITASLNFSWYVYPFAHHLYWLACLMATQITHYTHTTLDTLYTLYYTLYTLHYTLHSRHTTLYTTWHMTHDTLYTTLSAHCTLHYTLHATRYTLGTLHSTLHATFYAAHATLTTDCSFIGVFFSLTLCTGQGLQETDLVDSFYKQLRKRRSHSLWLWTRLVLLQTDLLCLFVCLFQRLVCVNKTSISWPT